MGKFVAAVIAAALLMPQAFAQDQPGVWKTALKVAGVEPQ